RRMEATREEHQRLLASYNADPASQNPEHARQLRAALQTSVTTCRRAVERLVLEVRDAFESVQDISRASDAASLSAIGRLVAKWEARAGTLPDSDAFHEALVALSAAAGDLASLRQLLEERAALAAQRLASATERAKAAE